MKEVLCLGVDLASKRFEDIGTATLSFSTSDPPSWTECRIGVIDWPDERPTPAAVVRAIDEFADKHGVVAVSIDGPQGWRSPEADGRPGVGRRCEYDARTPGKTGECRICFPGTYLGWVEFSIEVFARLLAGRAELVNGPVTSSLPLPARGRYHLLECFSTSTWRTAGLVPLPGKGRCRREEVGRFAEALRRRFGLPEFDVQGHHDHLQAVVAALPAAALLGGPCDPIDRGEPGRLYPAEGDAPAHRIEGFIWDARPKDEGGAGRDPIPTVAAGGDAGAGGPPPAEDPEDVRNPLLPDERDESHAEILSRGVDLFRHLVRQANAGEAVGISYAGFVCFLYGVDDFAEVAGRKYMPGDTKFIIRLASLVTESAGGRQAVTRDKVTIIRAGMDTFIWPSASGHDRSARAWDPGPYKPSYTREAWKAIFPDDRRRLINDAERRTISVAASTL